MTIGEAKELFKERYTKVGLTLVDEQSDSLLFSRGPAKWVADEKDLAEYVALEGRFAEFERNPSECSICSKTYREQALVDIDVFPAPIFGSGKTEIVFGDPSSGVPYAVFSKSSALYRAYYRFADGVLEWSSRNFRYLGTGRPNIQKRLVDRIIAVPVIRVEGMRAASIDEAVRISDEIISGCLFQLASLKSLPHRIRTKWPRMRAIGPIPPPPTGPMPSREEGGDPPLGLLKVNPIRDLVSLYTLGTGTSYPQFQFLAYYQVIEYFFVKIADEVLYDKLTRRLNDLSFKCQPGHLDRLIQDVTDHQRETDEVEMLKSVLKKYIDETDLISFVTDYEQKIGTKQYTKKRTLFGAELMVNPVTGHIFGTIAKTIKTVRNALVHSSDRYQRTERYVPFTGDEELVENEIPLMRYLAEKIIIASATPKQ